MSNFKKNDLYLGRYKKNISDLKKKLDDNYVFNDKKNISDKDKIINIKYLIDNIENDGVINENTKDYDKYKQSYLYKSIANNKNRKIRDKQNLNSYLWYYSTGRLDLDINANIPSNNVQKNIFEKNSISKENSENDFKKLNYLTKKVIEQKKNIEYTDSWKNLFKINTKMDIFYIIIRVIFICILLYSLIQYVFSTYQILNKDSDSGFDIGIFLLFYIIISAVILFINFGFSFTSNKLPNFFDILSGNNKNEDKSNYIYYPGEIIKKEDNDDEDNNNENTESGDSGNNGESDESGESGDGNEIENFTCCPKKGTTGISGNDISNCDTENTEGSGGGSRSSRNLGPDCNDTFYGCCKNPDGTNSEKISLTYDNVNCTNENNRLTEYI